MALIAISTQKNPFISDMDSKKVRLFDLYCEINVLHEQIQKINEIIGARELTPVDLLSDTEFLIGTEKKKVLKRWELFIKSGYNPASFSDALYKHLSLHCGYIDHYDREGFYGSYWCDDLVKHAAEQDMAVRAVTASFPGWRIFLRQFRISGNFQDININMVYILKKYLTSLTKELENEVVSIFEYDITNSGRLFLERKTTLRNDVDVYREKIVQLTTEIDDMDEQAFIDEFTRYYRNQFPSIDWSFMQKREIAS